MQSFHRRDAAMRFRTAWRRLGPCRGLAAAALLAVLSGCSSIVIHDRPILDRTSLEVAAQTAPVPAEPAALLQAGIALDRKHPDWAITYFRDAALKALPLVQQEGVSPQLHIDAAFGAQGVYRRAIEFMLETANRQALRERARWTDVLARAGVAVRGRVSLYEAAACQEVLSTRRFEVRGIRHQKGQGGIGAPVVARFTRAGQWGELPTETSGAISHPCEMHFPQSLYRAASAVVRPASGPGEEIAVLELHDPLIEPAMLWPPAAEGPALPLAYDMTVPLARQIHVANLNLLGAIGVFFPSEYNGRTGVFLLDPYEPGKIPVVFVHGLMSSPQAWINAMNELRGDPELRKHYQFWMFFYSTGNPILASAARFRRSLNELRSQLDPDAKDAAFDHMVLMGHSMGGLLSRLAISHSGQSLWNTASKVPPEQIEMEPELKDLLLQALFFEPIPMVRRVVFISTPHRGSPLGDELIGRLASRMIRVPGEILEIRQTLARYNGAASVSEAFRGSRYATSVAQLGQGNPVLQAINTAPMSEAVPYHSIVGYNGKEPLPQGGDGIVPYSSAHLEGALSELVITSDHSAQEKAEAIVEMRRILALHLDEFGLERESLAEGGRPPARINRPQGQTPVRYVLKDPAPDSARHRLAGGVAPPEPRVTR